MILSAEAFKTKKVLSSDGREVGQVTGVQFDVQTWKVAWIDVKVPRDTLPDLGMKKPLMGTHSIKVSPDRISNVTDTVMLSPTIAELGAFANSDTEADGVAKL